MVFLDSLHWQLKEKMVSGLAGAGNAIADTLLTGEANKIFFITAVRINITKTTATAVQIGIQKPFTASPGLGGNDILLHNKDMEGSQQGAEYPNDKNPPNRGAFVMPKDLLRLDIALTAAETIAYKGMVRYLEAEIQPSEVTRQAPVKPIGWWQ